jgi:hypothetical protein
MDRRISIIIVLVILIVAVFLWKRNSGGSKKERAKGGKGKEKARGGRGRGRGRGRSSGSSGGGNRTSDEEKPAASGDPDLVADARELYNLVHEDLAQGMQLDEFEDLAGDLAGDNPEEVYIDLKQLYNEAMDKNLDPAKSVTLDSYIEVLENSD